MGAGEKVVKFTPKELRALGGFFNGTLVHFRSHRRTSFCEQFTAKFKILKRKVRCLKYLHPKRIWRAMRRRHSTSYKKIEHAKGENKHSSDL